MGIADNIWQREYYLAKSQLTFVGTYSMLDIIGLKGMLGLWVLRRP